MFSYFAIWATTRLAHLVILFDAKVDAGWKPAYEMRLTKRGGCIYAVHSTHLGLATLLLQDPEALDELLKAFQGGEVRHG